MALQDTNVVNEIFWANMAAEQVYSAFEKRLKAVEQLQNLIKWLFGLFSAGGILMAFFAKPYDLSHIGIFFVGLGFAILIVAYFFTTQAAFPVAMELRPNEPETIRTAFTASIITTTTKFQLASTITMIGFLCTSAGIVLQFWQPEKVAVTKNEPGIFFKSSIETKGDSSFIPITVSSQKNIPVYVSISTCDKDLIKSDPSYSKPLFYSPFRTDSSGHVYVSYFIPNKSLKCFEVRVSSFETKDSIVRETVLKKMLTKK